MFIQEVISIIWKEKEQIYKKLLTKYKGWDVKALLEGLNAQSMDYYQRGNGFFNRLITKGCSQHFKNTGLSGCSMCNLHKDIKTVAMLCALYEKDKQQYSRVVLNSFRNRRAEVCVRHWREYVFSSDFLNEDEISDECLDGLFGDCGLYKKKPLHIEFETHVTSINKERLKKLRGYFPNTKIWLRIGVECENEWLRVHWLNKPISNQVIIDAIELCHSYGIKIIANVLLGLPGLTEYWSLYEFCRTAFWLFHHHIDQISCSILDRKPYTLQYFIYENFKDNQILNRIGIADGQHTGVPWLFTLLEALKICNKIEEQIIKKIVFGQFEESYISGVHQMAYNAELSCQCNQKIFEYIRTKPQEIIYNFNSLINDPCYFPYLVLREKQKKICSEQENIQIISNEIAKRYGIAGEL